MVRAGIDGPVQHHGPHVGREELGVGRPEQRAVGVPDEGQLGVAQGGSDPVEVPGRVDGADVGQDGPAVLLALGGEGLVVAQQGQPGGRGGGDGVDPVARVAARGRQLTGAGDRAAPFHPTRVERDDVEAVEQFGRQHRQLVGQVVDARGPRPTRVDDQ